MERIKIPTPFLLRLEAWGLSPRDILRQACLPEALLQQEEEIGISVRQLFALWTAIGERSGDPAIGLKIGIDIQVARYDPASIAALSARSYQEALTKLARYKRLCCSEEARLAEEDGRWTLEVTWPLVSEPEPPLLLDVAFATMVELGRRGSGQRLHPEWVELKRDPAHRDMYETHFDCPVRFRADRNALVFARQTLEQSFVTHNPALLAMLSPALEAALTDYLAQQNLTDRARAIITRRLAGQRPTIQDVAVELNMSARTFQRRLADVGTTYHRLLEEATSEMAQHYLVESSLSLNEISYLLGYAEPNSFHRAFQQWKGAPPGQWRAVQNRSRAL